MAQAMFGAGCFWGVEATFKKVEGVTKTEVGYAGGGKDDPTYQEVCGDTTGHAEVVVVDFDAEAVSFADLLEVFWSCHNPTTLNRQGSDVGSQYRSVIFTFDDEQQTLAEKSKAGQEASGRFKGPVVTAIEPVSSYWPAEDYHQNYFEKEGIGACPV
ncbi:MAG: peptide-methionine (S)-S-oxide reductase MsrA [Proteobacteria bacterium]|nr:peptide-methionine (S)-S-oxide reductase MsrA [Pseudomonadota bacterium]